MSVDGDICHGRSICLNDDDADITSGSAYLFELGAPVVTLKNGDDLQDAIDAAESGTRIQLCTGTYSTGFNESFVIDKGLTIIGIEPNVVISGQIAGMMPGIAVSADDVVLQDFIYLPPSFGGSGGAGISANDVTGLTLDGISTRTNDPGDASLISLENSNGVVLQNLVLNRSNQGAGVELVGTSVATFQNVTTSNNALGAVLASGGSTLSIDLAENTLMEERAITVLDAASVIAVEGETHTVTNVATTVFTDDGEATATSIALALNSSATNTDSAIFEQAGDEFVVTSIDLSIQAAIDEAEADDEIHLKVSGFTPPAALTVDQADLRLFGDSDPAPVINGALTVAADGVALETISFSDGTVRLEAAGATLTEIDVQASTGYGIELAGATGVTLSGCSTNDNALGGIGVSGSASLNSFTVKQSGATAPENQIAENRAVVIEDAESSATPANSTELFLIENGPRSIYTYAEALALDIAVAEDSGAATVTDLTATGEKLVVSADLSLAAAVATAESGATVCLRNGSHTEAPQIVIDGGRTLTITGDAGTTLTQTATDSGFDPCGFFLVESGATLNLEALAIDGMAVPFCEAIHSEGTTNITDVTFSSIGGTAIAYLGTTAGGTIENSNISGAGSAVTIDDATVTLTGNTISGNGTGIAILTDGTTGSVTITDNNLASNSTAGVSSAGLEVNALRNYWGSADGPAGTGPGTGSAITTDVDADPFYADAALTMIRSITVTVSDPKDVANDTDFATLAEAETAVIPGGTITVNAGTFAGDVTIDQEGVMLTSDPNFLTCIDGLVTVSASDVTISDLKLTNPGAASVIAAAAPTNLQIVGNTISEVGTEASVFDTVAISISGAPSNLTIEDNTFDMLGNDGTVSMGSTTATVISAGAGGADTTITGNSLTNITANNGAVGISLDLAATNTTVTNNNFAAIFGDTEGGNSTAIDFTGAVVADPAALVRENCFSNLGTGVSAAAGPIDVSENFWGEANGPLGQLAQGLDEDIAIEGNGVSTGENIVFVSFYNSTEKDFLLSSTITVDASFDEENNRLGLDAFTGIQEGIDHLIPTGSITVAGGEYAGDVTVDRAATIDGPLAATPAVTGSNAAGTAPTLAANAARAATDEAAIEGTVTFAADHIVFRSFFVTNPDGTTGIDIARAQQVLVENCVITDIGTAPGLTGTQGIYIRPDANEDVGIEVKGNFIATVGSPSGSDSNKGIFIGDSVQTATPTGIDLSGNVIASIDAAQGAYGIQVNYGTNAGGTTGVAIAGNTISDLDGGWAYGIALETTTPDTSVVENVISETNDRVLAEGEFPGVALLFGNNNESESVEVRANVFATSNASGVVVIETVGPYFGGNRDAVIDGLPMVDASNNYWGAADGPGRFPGMSVGIGSGSAVSANVTFAPWFIDEARSSASGTVGPGLVDVTGDETFGTLTVLPDTTYTVDGGSLTVTDLGLLPGAVLDVIGGDLTIAGSTFSGTFTFFNSLDTIVIGGDTRILPAADGLMLASDITIASGTTVTVDGGRLIIDGSEIDRVGETGTYTFNINAGSNFLLVRSRVSQGTIMTAAEATEIFDNELVATSVTAADSGAEVFHNILLDGSISDTDTIVDGWGNVASAADTQNNFPLTLVLPDPISGVGDQAARTISSDGAAYIQPTDRIAAELSVDSLTEDISGFDVRLGFNADFFEIMPFGGNGILAAGSFTQSLSNAFGSLTPGEIGFADASYGLSPGGSPTRDPQTVGALILDGQGKEGETRIFHRSARDPDAALRHAQLTVDEEITLRPFTTRPVRVFADGQAPAINAASAQGVQVHDSVDGAVTVVGEENAFALRNGNPIQITFTASDTGLAGLDASDATNDLRLTATSEDATYSPQIVTAETTLSEEDGEFTTYTALLTLPLDAPNGTYTLGATVADRSGNLSILAALGTFELATEVALDLAIEDFEGEKRPVTFVATDVDGVELKEYTRTLCFPEEGVGFDQS